MAFNRNKLKGTGVAIVTPFNSDDTIDFSSLKKVVNHIIKGKCEYIVALGTTGESVTLSKEEKAAVTKCIVDAVKGRVPVILGIGGNNTKEILYSLKNSDLTGISAILSVSPYYNKPNQRGIYEHYKLIAGATSLPIILYNVPGRTASNLTAETTLKLAEDFKNIIAVKEASGSMEQIMKIIKHKPKDFMVISGDDNLTLSILACGGDGVISVVANAYPKGFSEMVRQALKGNFDQARKLNYKHTDIVEQLFADGSPGGVKEFLHLMGLCQPHVRLPLYKVNDHVLKRIKELAAAYK
jgi:4-hydroxy-tetrahydrodipicolinate synthase